jgi:hypothetical protein
VQFVKDGAAAGKPWVGNAVAALVCGGLSSLRLAHAEATAQQILAMHHPPSALPQPRDTYDVRRQGGSILLGASQCLTPLVTRTLTKKGLARPLLQV